MPAPFRDGDHVVDDVDDALHGLLSSADEQYVLRHAADCPICAIALQEAKRRQAAVQALPTPEAAPELANAVIDRVHTLAGGPSAQQRLVRLWTLRCVAAALALVVLIHLWFILHKPSTYDLRLLGQAQMLSGAPASLRTQLTHGGIPVAGANIQLTLFDPNAGRQVTLVSYTTDTAGTGSPTFTFPGWPDGTYTLRALATDGFETASLDQPLTLKRESRLMLSTDKPVYQPGQTIHMRALALRRPDFKPVAAADAVFTLTDP